MNILITGGTGLLGKALIEMNTGMHKIVSTYLGNYDISLDNAAVIYRKLDVRDKQGYVQLFKEFRPNVVIHTAGIGNPDYAEKNKQEAWDINVGGTQNLIDCAEAVDSKFIYISSNGIYGGDSAPYGEETETRPINYYGQVKLKGEEITRKSLIPHAIVRPILMYGWNHPFERLNIVTLSLRKLREEQIVNAYSDIFVNPLFVFQCAQAIWKIVFEDKYDTFNIGGKDRLSIFEFLETTARIFGYDDKLIKPVSQGFFKELVKRPIDTSYNTEKMEKILGIKPLSAEEGLKAMKERKMYARGVNFSSYTHL